MSSRVELLVGLGNPGARYDGTRHNAGFWLLDRLAADAGAGLRAEPKFRADVGKMQLAGHDAWLARPTGFMNCSGEAVGAIARFYKIPVENILVAHDELDLPPGTARLKRGGGHGGHNGLRDIIDHLGGNEFVRLRIGIGHPGRADLVTDYVLGAPSRDDGQLIDEAITAALPVMPLLLAGEFEKAMHRLHTA
jgi:PTH1 family peptidyl-tRNA hydrolase